MEKKHFLHLVLLLVVVLCPAATFGKSASVLLREGLYAEEIEGDLDAAIEIYRQIIADSTAQRKLVAQALYRQGMCFLKKRNEPEARAALQKLVNEYKDQTDIVEKARPLLDDLGNADPAALMPPGTMMYIEIGSPGRQIETILNMLKGTPFENPLAVLANQGQGGGATNPADMVGALLNPSMMAEFKKIRGIGVGITGLAQDSPPATIVLFPGKSDALRGILLAALGMLGRSTDPIEGMTAVTLPDGGGAAYDDTVVIVATPAAGAMDRLRWSVRQYKGLANGPTLATSNRSFRKISKQARQQNALTIWMNVNEAFDGLTKIMPPEAIPQEIRMADSMIDFKNVNDLIATLSLRETGVAVEANLNFKEGHQSLAYHMIRTPNLNKNALKAVPPEAIALISVALGEADTPQAQALSEQIKNGMGLDLGPELFENIEQITLFALPLGKVAESTDGQLPAALNSLGLAVTSSNPQKTQQILSTLLQSVNLLMPGAGASEPVDGKYDFTLVNYQKVFCRINEAAKTTVVSLSPDLADTSVAALAGGPSAMRRGHFGDALSTLSPTTSKLVTVNVAGALRFARENMELPSEAAEKVGEALGQLAGASEKTTVRLQTNEETNSLGIRLSVSDLPPVGEVFGPIMQIVQTMQTVEAQQAGRQTATRIPAGIAATETAPTIDGKPDASWADAPQYDLKNSFYGAPSSDADLSASFKALYDEDHLYLLVDVTDDDLQNDSDDFWQDDSVEVFIDADNSRSESYDDNDYHYHFGWDASSPALGEAHHGNMRGVAAAFARTEAGYRAEIKLPWSTLGTKPVAGISIGFDVQVNDDDGGGERDSKIAWHAPQDDAYLNPQAFGAAQPLGLVGWWKLDESGGTTATDGSGNGHHALTRGNPTWQPAGGKVSGAVALDGDGDYLEIPDESAFDFTSGVTVAVWVKADSLDKPYQAIVTKGEWAWRIQRNEETSTLEFACSGVRIPSEHPYGPLYGTREITLGQWHHVAGVYDGKRMSLYIDGTLDASQEASGPIGVDDDPVLIGENAEQRERFWTGQIDDVRVYNHGLSDEDVAVLARGKTTP